jgi:hypothetical protein
MKMELQKFTTNFEGKRLNGPNDLWLDNERNLFYRPFVCERLLEKF